ncbi:MAG: CoA transferase subunit A [Candidatus Marinimicrobia bacterium]|nr:CoA transferase subunit A [Candidatus Neomarinimicrobiota bacterium]MBL7023014.1 CoA transferase subunit A [Candidatus Neomarinimicrobiota bacterium]MBL7109654.1 CoA transferase subunit A [Candidatus Neomarinimicrobiota bacterium]
MKIVAEGQKELIQKPDLDAFRQWNRENKSKELIDKIMSESEAISKFLKDGDYLGIELYGTVRAPMSLTREIIRQGYKRLRCAGQGVFESDLLAASNSVKELDWTYIGLEVYGLSSNLRRAVEGGYVENIVEWSNAALSWRFKATAMGVPFIPTKVMLGTDTFKYSSAKAVECPFTGDTVGLLPALILDVGIIHVSRADKFGNAQIDGISGFAEEMARASKRLIISAEEIVDEDVIRSNPEKTIIPYYLVDAVVEAPFGSHPGEMTYEYERDEEHIKSYYSDSKDVDKTKAYLDKWIYNVESHDEYLDLVGKDKLKSLKIERNK